MKFEISFLPIKILFLLGCAFGLALTGCSVKGSISEDSQIGLAEQFSQNNGLVAGSSQNELINGYRVSGSIADTMGGMQEVVNGFTVIQSIQGNINSTSFEMSRQ